MDIQYMTPLLSGPRLKKGPVLLFHDQAVHRESGVRYAASRFITYREEGVITDQNNVSGKI
jgi:hypothetical protein